MVIKAKFECTGTSNNRGSLDVAFEPVVAGASEQNNHFSEATPYGGLHLGGVKQEVFDSFEVGREYDITIMPNQEVNSDE